MSYQEKKAIATMSSAVILLISYLVYIVGKYNDLGRELLSDLSFWASTMLTFVIVGIVITIIIQIVFHVFLAISIAVRKEVRNELKEVKENEDKEITEFKRKKEIEEEIKSEITDVDDEMDKLISLKSMRNAYMFVGVGFVLSLISVILKFQTGIMINILFLSFMTGSIIEGISKIYFYRRGV